MLPIRKQGHRFLSHVSFRCPNEISLFFAYGTMSFPSGKWDCRCIGFAAAAELGQVDWVSFVCCTLHTLAHFRRGNGFSQQKIRVPKKLDRVLRVFRTRKAIHYYRSSGAGRSFRQCGSTLHLKSFELREQLNLWIGRFFVVAIIEK